MNINYFFWTKLNTHLPDRLHKWKRFNISNGSSNLYKTYIGIIRSFFYAIFYFISDMRNHLYSCTKIITSPFFSDHRLINPSSSKITVPACFSSNKTLIMTKIKISLSSIRCNKYFSMLEGTHCSRINIYIWIEFYHTD